MSVLECCEAARALEHAGQYEEARVQMCEWWGSIGERPNLEGLGTREATEVKLRVGCLTSWLGSARQIEGAQEVALDLLSEYARTFESLGDTERQGEAQVGMAHAYVRKASYDEARVVLRCALGRLAPEGEQALGAVVWQTIVECASGAFDEAMRLHEKAARRFEGNDVPPRLKATFFYNWAVTHRKLGNIDEALLKYAVAKKALEETGDTSRLAIVETALGFLYYTIKSYVEAVEHTQQAIYLYEAEANKRGVAEATETLARVLVEVGDYTRAELAAQSAVNILRAGDEKALFIEALTSYGTALARQGRRREAHAAFGEAEEEALNYVGSTVAGAVAQKMIEELVAPLCLNAGLTLEEPVNLLEKSIIRGALKVSEKSMKEAGFLLGVEYNSLRYIINERHPELREDRTRIYQRPHRSIIKKSSSNVRKMTKDRRKS